MQLVERPAFFPEVSITGRTVGPMVDTGCDHPGGRIYVDRLEWQLMNDLFGGATPEEVRRLHAVIEQERAGRLEAEARLQRIGAAVAGEVLAV